MYSYARLVAVLSLLVAAPLVSRAADPVPPPAATATEPAAKHDTTELEDRMEEMSSAFKRLRRQITDSSKNAQSLEQVAKLRASAEKAVNLTPAKAGDLSSESARAKLKADYEEEMKHLLSELTRLETALKANDNTEAEKILREINNVQREAHKQYKKPKS